MALTLTVRLFCHCDLSSTVLSGLHRDRTWGMTGLGVACSHVLTEMCSEWMIQGKPSLA